MGTVYVRVLAIKVVVFIDISMKQMFCMVDSVAGDFE